MRTRPTLLLPSGCCRRLWTFVVLSAFLLVLLFVLSRFSSTANGINCVRARCGPAAIGRILPPLKVQSRYYIRQAARPRKDGLQLDKALYHTGWFGGLEHVPGATIRPNRTISGRSAAPLSKSKPARKPWRSKWDNEPCELADKGRCKQFFSCMDSGRPTQARTPGGAANLSILWRQRKIPPGTHLLTMTCFIFWVFGRYGGQQQVTT